jgi:hypothetical protein
MIGVVVHGDVEAFGRGEIDCADRLTGDEPALRVETGGGEGQTEQRRWKQSKHEISPLQER